MQHKKGSKLIFCNTIKSLHEVEYYLNQMKIETTSLHGDLNHNMRKANFDKFNGKAVSIMLTTDLGSRGLDFPFLEHVINYDFPMSISDYLHRAGRTGRAGKPGTVYTLYHQKNIDIINQLRASHDSNKPLDIKRSAYSLSNKEDLQ
jgi:superfamily II DNA/RNA helicase